MNHQDRIFIDTINTSGNVLKVLKNCLNEMTEVLVTEFFPQDHIIIKKYNERKKINKRTSWFWIDLNLTLSIVVDDCENTFIKIETEPYYESIPLLNEDEVSEPVLCDVTELIQRFF